MERQHLAIKSTKSIVAQLLLNLNIDFILFFFYKRAKKQKCVRWKQKYLIAFKRNK